MYVIKRLRGRDFFSMIFLLKRISLALKIQYSVIYEPCPIISYQGSKSMLVIKILLYRNIAALFEHFRLYLDVKRSPYRGNSDSFLLKSFEISDLVTRYY